MCGRIECEEHEEIAWTTLWSPLNLNELAIGLISTYTGQYSGQLSGNVIQCGTAHVV